MVDPTDLSKETESAENLEPKNVEEIVDEKPAIEPKTVKKKFTMD